MADNINQFVEIRKSAKHGNGLFALKDFGKGESVYSFKKGRIVKYNEIQNLSEQEKIHLDKIGENEYEIIEPPGCYTNHSCEPNIEEKDRTGYALTDIKKGEEITIDYDKIAYLEKPFECHCGSKNCRGFVRGEEIKSKSAMGNKKVQTLCYVFKDDQVLLGLKKKGLGTGNYNGFGGNVKSGESLVDATRREFLEEAGIHVADIIEQGVIDFEFDGSPEILEVHIFRADSFSGEPLESDEMRPAWFDLNQLPYDKMWPDDKYWMPLFLTGKKFYGKFLFDKSDKIINQTIEEVREI